MLKKTVLQSCNTFHKCIEKIAISSTINCKKNSQWLYSKEGNNDTAQYINNKLRVCT